MILEQDLLRQAGGDESLIAEMRSNARKNGMLYQMASEELQRDSAGQAEVGEKRSREELTDMLGMSQEIVKNTKIALDNKNAALEAVKQETIEVEKQTTMRSKELETKVTLQSKERNEILQFEAKRQANELKHIDSVYTKKIQYERELKLIQEGVAGGAKSNVTENLKEPAATIKSVAVENFLRPSNMTSKVWNTVLQKAGRKAIADLDFLRHVHEDGFLVKGFHLYEKDAIKKLIEEEVKAATGAEKITQQPINFNISLGV